MKKSLTIFFGIGAATLLFISLKVAKPSEADASSSALTKTQVKQSETHPTDNVSESTQTKNQTVDDTPEQNFTISKIREQIEKWDNLDSFESLLNNGDDSYKILAVPENDVFGYVSGTENVGAATVTDSEGNVIREDNPSTDPKAATFVQVRELLESLKAQ